MNGNSGRRRAFLMLLLTAGLSVFLHAGIIVKTFHDKNNNGIFDPGESLITGLSVTATDQIGNTYSLTDDGKGTHELSIVPSRVRLQVSGYHSDLRQGAAGPSSIFFGVDGQTFFVPVLRQFENDGTNTTILIPCFEKGSSANKPNSPALVAFPYSVNGVAQAYGGTAPNPRMDASIAQIGSTWGMAYQEREKRAFLSTILKRHVDLGPEGLGGIYQADYLEDPQNPTITSFNLQGIHPANGPVIDLGQVNRNIVDGPIDEQNPYALSSAEDFSQRASYDIDAFQKVGQSGYGDIDLTEDENQLWLVNTYQRSLISLEVPKRELDLSSSTLRHYPIDALKNIPDTEMRYVRCINTGGNSNYQGSESFTDAHRTAWDRNKYSIDGTPDYKLFTVTNTMNAAEGTSSAELYHTWRKGRTFSYDIPVPKEETYTVILHFAEPNNYQPGDRVFDVLAEGSTKLNNFDVSATAGSPHKAITTQFTVEVTGPTLTLEFKAEFANKVREAIINGIEIRGTSMVKTGHLRPWGLEFHHGRGYLGLVNDASISQSRDHLMGYVVSFNPANLDEGVKEEVAFPLAYPRERTSNAHLTEPQPLRTAAWMPWADNWEQTHIPLDDPLGFTNGLLCSYPQPMISDINFTEDGSMIINVMDRWAHQTGYLNYATILPEKTLIIGYASGDILKAFKEGNAYDLEKNNQDDGKLYNNTDGPSYAGEFFYQDEFQSKEVAHHGELNTGAAAILPGSYEVVTTVYNPVETLLEHFDFNGVYTQGLHFYSTESGQKNRAYLFVDQFNVGKANGLGDIEMAATAPFGEVGNYLWCDANANGIQDPSEFGIEGIQLSLHDKDNSLALVGTTISDDTGHYVFQNLLPNRCYEIRVSLSQLMTLGYSGLVAPASAGTDTTIDSDGDPDMLPGFVVAMFCTDAQANNQHDLDFGFLGPRALDVEKSDCEDPMSGCATFTFSQLADCVDTSGLNEVRFFATMGQADSMLNEITSTTIQVCDDDTVLYARVNIPGDLMCFSIAQVTLREITPTSAPQNFTATVCPAPTFDAISFLQSQGYGGTNAQFFSNAGLTQAIGHPIATPSYPLTIYFMDVAGAQACMVTGSITIQALPEAMLDAGNPVETCGLQCVDLTQLAASFTSNGSGATTAMWTTSGSGSFINDASYAGARFYCPDSLDMYNGMVTLRLAVTDDPCGRSIADSVVITILSSLPRFIDPDRRDTIDCTHPFLEDQVNHDTFPRCRLVSDCGDTVTARVIDYDILSGRCDSIVKRIVRTQLVTYRKVDYYCMDTIYVRGLDFNNFTCPPMRDSVYCHAGYLKDSYGHPSPSVTGVPMAGDVPLWPKPHSKCEVLVHYYDTEFSGDCPMTIRRTWWIKNNCLDTLITCEQWIMIYDTVGPTVTKLDSAKLFLPIVSTSTHDCYADFYVPAIGFEDTCSGVKMVKAIVHNAGSTILTYNPQSKCFESHHKFRIPISELDFFGGQFQFSYLTYEALDSCHNVTVIDSLPIIAVDRVKPVAICDKGLNITMSDTLIWVAAENFQEGSWDNCGINMILARRTDWATACGVNLCDDIHLLDSTEHHDYLWCSRLESDKHLNPVEAHYQKTIEWLCSDDKKCTLPILLGWFYDLVKYATLECLDHPYPVDGQYLDQILGGSSRFGSELDLLVQAVIPCVKTVEADSLEQALEIYFSNPANADLFFRLFEDYFQIFFSGALLNERAIFDLGKQIGGGWSDAVPFCCEDACKEVMVEILVMDYWCNWTKCWTTVNIEDKTPPKVVHELGDVHITCTAYKEFYEDAVENAQAGDFTEINKLLGGYDKVRYDAYHAPPAPKTTDVLDILCDSVLVKKDSLIYDEHLGYRWISYQFYQAVYDTVKYHRYRGQIADDCGLVCIEEKPWVNFDHCGNGYIKRVFKFVGQCYTESTGHFTDTIVKHQTIWVKGDCHLRKSMFDYPEDQVVYACDLIYDPNGSGNVGGVLDPLHTGRPEYLFDNDCRLVGIGYFDQVYRIVGGDEGCYKIIRTWCLADWCALGGYDNDPKWWFNPRYQGKYLTWTQKLFLVDTVIPTCTISLEDQIVAPSCTYDLHTDVLLEDNCGILDYSWEILNKDKLRIAYGFGKTKEGEHSFLVENPNMTPGQYRLKVRVGDGCQNEGICEKLFSIESSKKPTPVCLTSLTIELTPMDLNADGTIDTAIGQIWASEFDRSSSAPCGSLSTDLKFRLDRASDGAPALPADDQLSFGCGDLGTQLLRLYVLDKSGTWDYCEVILQVQNNSGGCQGAPVLGQISGLITTEAGSVIRDVQLSLTDEQGSTIHETTVSGSYQLEMLQGRRGYLSPQKDTDHLNGVSTRDLISIQKHLLGKEKLSSWFREQAADANNNGDVSVLDLILLRKLILGMIDRLPDTESWRFFDRETRARKYHINPMQEEMYVHFTGVKVGDVNLDSDPTQKSNRSGAPLVLQLDDQELHPGTVHLPVKVKNSSHLAGIQFTLEGDQGKIRLKSFHDGLLKPGLENFFVNQDWMTFSAYGEKGQPWQISAGEHLFFLEIEVMDHVTLSHAVSISSRVTTAEAYDHEDRTQSIALEFRTMATPREFELFQNIPNPFPGSTMIAFRTVVTSPVSLRIYDLHGKQVYIREEITPAGYHEWPVDLSNLTYGGVLYYQLSTDEHTDVKKMILITR